MAYQAVGSFTDELGRTVYYDADGQQSLLPGHFVQQEAERDRILAETVVANSPQQLVGASGNANIVDSTTNVGSANEIASYINDTSKSWDDKAAWMRANGYTSQTVADALLSANQAYTQDPENLANKIELALSGTNGYKRGDFGVQLGIMDTYREAYTPTTAADYKAKIDAENARNKAEWDRGVRAGPVSAGDTFNLQKIAKTAGGASGTNPGSTLSPTNPGSTLSPTNPGGTDTQTPTSRFDFKINKPTTPRVKHTAPTHTPYRSRFPSADVSTPEARNPVPPATPSAPPPSSSVAQVQTYLDQLRAKTAARRSAIGAPSRFNLSNN